MPRTAFTLIELLVVIAVIAVIAAILFPVFAKAREKARQTTCASNEKQLALGVLMYAQDYDETLLPTAATDDGVSITAIWPDLLRPYLKSDRVRYCPSDPDKDAQDALTGSYGLNVLNFCDFTDPGCLPLETLADFHAPSETVMMTELGTGNYGSFTDLTTPRPGAYRLTAPDGDVSEETQARPAARHFERANVAWMDGHVKTLRLGQFYTGQTPPDKYLTP